MPKLPIKNKKIVVIVAMSLLVILVLTLVIIKMIPAGSGAPQDDSADFTSTVGNIEATAAGYLNGGDAESGLKYYDEQIELRKDEEEKKVLWMSKSNFARAAGQADIAIDAANKANEISPDITTTRAMAQAYAAGGDKEKALIYYKKLLEMRQAEEGETDPNKLAESREETLGSIIRRLEE